MRFLPSGDLDGSGGKLCYVTCTHALAVSSRDTQQSAWRVRDAMWQGSSHAWCGLQDFLFPAVGKPASLSCGRQTQGRFCKGGQLTTCKSQIYQGDQRSEVCKKCFEHRKIRGEKPSLWILWARSSTYPTESGPTWEAWNCLGLGSTCPAIPAKQNQKCTKRWEPPGMVMPISSKWWILSDERARNKGLVCGDLSRHPGKTVPFYNSIQPSSNTFLMCVRN